MGISPILQLFVSFAFLVQANKETNKYSQTQMERLSKRLKLSASSISESVDDIYLEHFGVAIKFLESKGLPIVNCKQ